MSNVRIVVIGTGIILVILAGLVLVSEDTSTGPKENLSLFLRQNRATNEIEEAYRFALENPQGVLSQVKCYCGCLKNQEHKNNRDCFINEDGSFDLMGLNCGLCVKTALLSKQMLAQGKSVQEISNYVDARWGKID